MALVPKIPANFNQPNTIKTGKFLWSLWTTLHKSTRVDQIDSFTNKLIEKKSLKWDIARDTVLKQIAASVTRPQRHHQLYENVSRVAKSFTRDLQSIRKPELCIDIRRLMPGQLDNILVGIIDESDEKDFVAIVKQCLLYRNLPSTEVLKRVLDYMVAIQRPDLIDEMAAVCRNTKESFYRNTAQLLPYKALSAWHSGNVRSALDYLQSGYRLHQKNRHDLREAFQTMAGETMIGGKSEAVLVAIVRTAEEIHREFDEIFVIACVWKTAFTSQWFSDQQIAGKLFDEHEELRKMVEKKSASLSHGFLTCHDVDAVHRLIELFLKYEQKDACSSSLKMLFNYQYWRRDLRACSEIAQFCLEIDRALSEIETQKLLNLLLNRPAELYRRIPKSECNKFEYKF